MKNDTKKILGLDMHFFLSSKFLFNCACFSDESLLVIHFCAQHFISYFSLSCMHTSYILHIARHQVKYFFPNLFPRDRNMRDQMEARISVIEKIQEEFGHDIREMKEQLARLTKLIEEHIRTITIHSQYPSPLPVQPVPHLFPHPLYPSPRPLIPATSNILSRTYDPNLRPLMPIPITMPAFVTAPRSVNQPDNSKGRPNRQKIGKDKA